MSSDRRRILRSQSLRAWAGTCHCRTGCSGPVPRLAGDTLRARQSLNHKQEVRAVVLCVGNAPGMHSMKLLDPATGTRVPGRLNVHASKVELPI